jgi:hypothetical protein
MNEIKEGLQKPVEEADLDLQERIEGFNKELMPLLGKYELGLAAIAKIVGDGRISADPVIVSVRRMRGESDQNVPTGAEAKPQGGMDNPDA